MRGQLNMFQRLVLYWRRFHPMNAVHAVRLDGAGSLPRLAEALEDALDCFGLRGVVVDAETGAYEYGLARPDGEAARLSQPSLDQAIASELNRPFPAWPTNPIRAFLYEEAGSHVVGLTYDHWAADAEAIAPALGRLVCRYLGLPAPQGPPLDLYPPPFRVLLARRLHTTAVLGTLLHTARNYAHMRRARRVRHADPEDLNMGFCLRTMPQGRYDALRAAAGAAGGTVNDLCLAAMARAAARHLPTHPRHPFRQGVGLGGAADLRRLVPDRWRRAFSLMLCYITLVVDRPGRKHVLAVARQVARMTAAVKRDESYLASLVTLGMGSFLGRRIKPRTVLRFPIRNTPICGGVSGFRLREDVAPPAALERVRDYIRGVATGPALPLVAQVSKSGDGATFGFCHRTTAVSAELAGRMADTFMAEMEEAAEAAP